MNQPDLSVAQKPSILVGTPFLGGVCHVPYLLSMLRLNDHANKAGLGFELFAVENESFLPRARAVIAHHFWKGTHTHLLFADADMGFRVEDLLAMVESNHDVVAGVGPQKSINWQGVIDAFTDGQLIHHSTLGRHGSKIVVNFKAGQSLETDASGCLEALDAGTGFMLIKRNVIERLRASSCQQTGFFRGRGNWASERIADLFAPMVENERYLTEDFAFCRRFQAIGGKVHVYVHADLEHVGNYVYRGNLLDHADVTRIEQ